jgi:ribosomal protein S18 acetylase RimI-like enzyme
MELEEFLIRRIQIEDADDITRIHRVITNSSEAIDFRRVVHESVGKSEDTSLVAVVGGKVVGFMIGYIVYGGFGFEKSAWIATLGVDPRYMGQGLGKSLANALFQVYRERGVRYIYSSVRWDSVDLLSFFKTLGFDRSNFINLRKELK